MLKGTTHYSVCRLFSFVAQVPWVKAAPREPGVLGCTVMFAVTPTIE